MQNVWRINLKPNADEGIDSRMFCINNGIPGVGWQVYIQNIAEYRDGSIALFIFHKMYGLENVTFYASSIWEKQKNRQTV